MFGCSLGRTHTNLILAGCSLGRTHTHTNHIIFGCSLGGKHKTPLMLVCSLGEHTYPQNSASSRRRRRRTCSDLTAAGSNARTWRPRAIDDGDRLQPLQHAQSGALRWLWLLHVHSWGGRSLWNVRILANLHRRRSQAQSSRLLPLKFPPLCQETANHEWKSIANLSLHRNDLPSLNGNADDIIDSKNLKKLIPGTFVRKRIVCKLSELIVKYVPRKRISFLRQGQARCPSSRTVCTRARRTNRES